MGSHRQLLFFYIWGGVGQVKESHCYGCGCPKDWIWKSLFFSTAICGILIICHEHRHLSLSTLSLAQDLESAVVSFGADTMTSHEGLCKTVASLCGGNCCLASNQCHMAVTREELRSLIYRRSQQFSPAAVISAALDNKPSKPAKLSTTMTASQYRLLNHFRAMTDETAAFFAIPSSEFFKNAFADSCLMPWFVFSFLPTYWKVYGIGVPIPILEPCLSKLINLLERVSYRCSHFWGLLFLSFSVQYQISAPTGNWFTADVIGWTH